MAADAAHRRVLVYTHNAIGLGHAVRTAAVVDGLRAVWPQTDFLVLSGSAVPQIFLAKGIDVLKLPSIRHALDEPGEPYRARFLSTMDNGPLFAWRSHIIGEAFERFAPDLVMIEHCLAGLMGEAAPILAKKRSGAPFTLVHLSRGIYREHPCVVVPCTNLLPDSGITSAYDRFYVLEDPSVVDVNREFLGADPALDSRIRYLGRIASLNAGEFGDPHSAAASLGLGQQPFVLVSLGRNGHIVELHSRVLTALASCPRDDRTATVVVPDPYLTPTLLDGVGAVAAECGARLLPVVPGLSSVIAAARLVVCRAGYNTINEVLQASVPALVIPEHHPSGEQERRAAGLPRDNITVRSEEEALAAPLAPWLARLMARVPTRLVFDFDRFRIGRAMADDLVALAVASGRGRATASS